ncbi:MAG: hypothetical protein H5U05_10815 [Candidatus Aminicenantes bacterium]|nr:hypothetical protein [Candidatus Aminicenantes bacterium]
MMMPIREIHVGDVYRNPMYDNGLEFVVVDIDFEEKMIKVQPVDSSQSRVEIGKPFWKSNRDRMFSESWRVLRGGSE